MTAPVAHRHQSYICLGLCSPQPHSTNLTPIFKDVEAEAQNGNLSRIQVSGHRRLGGDGVRWFWGKEPQHWCFPHSGLPATQTVPQDLSCQGSKQTGHLQSSTFLAEDLACHCKPHVPTPTSSPCLSQTPRPNPYWPQETQALSTPSFPSLPRKGERVQLLPVSTWRVTVHDCPLRFLWGGD